MNKQYLDCFTCSMSALCVDRLRAKYKKEG